MRSIVVWLAAAIALAVAGFGGAAAEAATGCPNTGKGAPGPYKVAFPVGSAKIGAANAKALDDVAKFAKARYSKVCLLGRADQQGNQRSNFDLSVRRAEAVASALEKRGVNPNSITVVGRGEAYGDWFTVVSKSQADRTVDITLSQ
jgi:outer membrane protein OmpA-like peptidoglycan-associated protein